MATHSSILAWRIPGTEDPGGLPSMGLHRVGYEGSDLAAACLLIIQFIMITKFSYKTFKGESKNAKFFVLRNILWAAKQFR